jgi:hypothetical protein
MYSESDLEAAVVAGALTPDQAAAFRTYVASSRHTPVVDEESFRLLSGFNDIFVSIAAVILLVALAWIGHAIPPNIEGDGPTPWMGLFVAVAAWGLAEYFTRQRRMALPSILLLLAFIGGTIATVGFTMVSSLTPDVLDDNPTLALLTIAAAAGAGVAAAFAHWRRFRVPITVAAGAAALVGLVLGLIGSGLASEAMTWEQEQMMKTALEASALVLGIGVFLFAMRWDSSDPRRETRRSDVAFWLHLLAAPLIVHPIFSLLGLTDGNATTLEAITVILLYVVIGLTALAIDRRALLVSALAYVLWALDSLFKTYGNVELSFALTALVIGSALLLLSAFWNTARRRVVAPLPAGLQTRLPVLDRAPTAAPLAA